MDLSGQEIGKKIKQYRKGKMTQQELAEKIGKTESSIRKYEKGLVTIPLDVLEQIASALGVDPLLLMGREYFKEIMTYPALAKGNDEYRRFVDYLNSLGYTVHDVEAKVLIQTEFDYTPDVEIAVELIKGKKKIVLSEDEFRKLESDTKETIVFKLWQKSQQEK